MISLLPGKTASDVSRFTIGWNAMRKALNPIHVSAPIFLLNPMLPVQQGPPSFALQLVQRALEESLGTLQSAIHKDV